jgi:hypothetical protein
MSGINGVQQCAGQARDAMTAESLKALTFVGIIYLTNPPPGGIIVIGQV